MSVVPIGRRVLTAARRNQPYVAPAVNLAYQAVGRYLRNRVDNYIGGGGRSQVVPISNHVSARPFEPIGLICYYK